jgi:hypothetical protein
MDQCGELGGLWVVLDHSPVWIWAAAGEVDVFNIIFCTQKKITEQILTFCHQKCRGRFFELFESRAGERMAVHSAKALNREVVAQKKLVSCQGRKWSAEGQTVMAINDWRASVGG